MAVRRFAVVPLLFLTMACAGARPKPKPAPALESAEPRAIDEFVGKQFAASGLVGLSLAVAKDGQIVLAKGYGVRSVKTGAPVDPDTLFAIGSITKQFTAACIFLLAEEGKLSVDDPVGKYFPDLTRASDITLLDLMNHVSGYPDYYPLDFVDRRTARPIAVDDLIRQYATGPLDFEPGSRFSYSNTGFVILGRVVEKVSGESFGAFLERRILKPLGLGHTRYDPDAADDAMAQGHTRFALGPWKADALEAKGWLSGAGAMWSTASDLARWDLALGSGQVLKPESYRRMTAPRRLASGAYSNYGCGVSVQSKVDQVALAHDGEVNGFIAVNAAVPSARAAVVVLTNTEEVTQAKRIWSTVLNAVMPKPPIPKVAGPGAVEVAREIFKSYQAGAVDRARLGEEFSFWLTEERVKEAAAQLAPWGVPLEAKLVRNWERGGMEVSLVELSFERGVLEVEMYRKPDGRIEELFVTRQ